MKFLVTMNMPSYSGNQVHQMIVDHNSNGLEEFVEALTRNDFVIVEEFYKVNNSDDYSSRGLVVLNHRYVGKIKEFIPHLGRVHESQRSYRQGA